MIQEDNKKAGTGATRQYSSATALGLHECVECIGDLSMFAENSFVRDTVTVSLCALALLQAAHHHSAPKQK